ncbi:hypothetical protein TWF569_000380 [Orbilia oligospora]|uniref:ATPase AAA-type core domain-containing protein n=1 Tax=Orbilia oligospora TaxID=2813651 RepID=A0A7C8JLQ2_ORBOL|nr:hypothetical protein TWF703_010441 [Orbilia oligospora]KAF3133761.1 hypothetical protein TWF594_008922 [Orbilia oligospora]KAF3154406.1 hypothetical protein TWF569_000380 [Orbilia oligospora]
MARSDDGDPQNKNRKRNSSGAEDSSSNSNHPAKKLNTGNDVKKRPVGRPPLNKTKGSGASGEENSKAGLNTENLGHSNSTDKNNQPPSLIKPTKQECIPVEESYLWDKSRIIQYQDNTLWMHGILTRAGYNGVCRALGHNWDLEEEDRDFTANMIDVKKVEKWLREGADPNLATNISQVLVVTGQCIFPVDNLPVIAFAALLGEPKIVRTLLSFGAKSSVIPSVLRLPYIKPQIFQLKSWEAVRWEFLDNVTTNKDTKWCNDVVFNGLRKCLNLSMRYDLHRGDSFKVTERHKQFAKSPLWDCSPLFRARFDIVGQEFGLKKLLNHVLMLTEKPDRGGKPTVLLFAGPSGHGKTELAKQMERYLGVPFHSENMASVKREDEFFGPHKPYKGWEDGSPVNNFLADNNGKRCIVLLDEVEKTGIDIRSALLVPFERGATLSDRRGGSSKMDISKVIWILTTNALDSTIMRFYEDKEPITPQLMAKEGQEFVVKMRKTLHGAFGAAFTSRIDLIVPFFPFSPDEQAVLADLEIGERKSQFKQPISLDPENRKLVGNINLSIEKDYKVCRIVARSYIVEEGVRSIKREVDNLEKETFDQCLDASEDAITEEDQKNETEYTLKADKTQGMVRVDVGKTTPKLQLG